MRRAQRGLRTALLAALLGLAPLLTPVSAARAEPERIDPNVPGLFKRIATKPGAQLSKEAGGAAGVSRPRAFDTFYVFGRKTVSGKTWLQVGPKASAAPSGWMPETAAIEIRHLLVLCPVKRQNRQRAMFFRDQASLAKIAGDSNRAQAYLELARKAAQDNAPAAEGVIGIEPENLASCRDAFTFMPIREAVEGGRARISGVGVGRFFHTLSVPLPPKASGEGDFRTGVVFVVDTSISMKPYIDRTRKAVARVSAAMARGEAGKRLSFGLVGYRDSRKASRSPEYVSLTAHPLEKTWRAAAFDAAIGNLKESPTSNADFREDAVAGVAEALKLPGWNDYPNRDIVLVTDAGMRDADDPMSETGLSIDWAASEARSKGVVVYSLFLKTKAGAADHAKALSQHQALTRGENSRATVATVTGGSVNEFGANLDKALDRVAKAVTEDAQQAAARLAASCANTQRLSEIDRMLCDLDQATQAARIEWLGRRQGVTPPAVANGWVADVALDSLDAMNRSFAYTPYLLLTRDQMQQLIDALKPLLKVTSTDIDTNRQKVVDIFKTAIARGAVDVNTLQGGGGSGGNSFRLSDAQNLGALLPAWIRELPLKSRFMTLKAEDWINPTMRRQHFVKVEALVTALERLTLEQRGWVKLAPDADRGDEVFPIEWDRIP